MALMDKIAKENKEFRSQFGQTTLPEPKARSLLDGVTMARPNASTGFVELECALKTPRERVGSVSQAVSLCVPTAFREQSCRTVLIREPPNGSSLSDDKLSDKAIRPAHALCLTSSQQTIPQKGNGPRTPSQDIRKGSAAEARILPERVQTTRSKTTPSPAVSDSPPVSSRFMKNLPRSAREPLIIGLRPAKASMDIISRPSPRPDVCVKPSERSNETVLHTELPKGSSLMGTKPSSRIALVPVSPVHGKVRNTAKLPDMERKKISPVKSESASQRSHVYKAARTLPNSTPNTRVASVLAPSTCPVVRAPAKPPDRKEKMGDVSRKKQMSAAEHSPAPKAALTLPKYTPISCIWAPPTPSSSKDGAPPSSRVFPRQRTCNAIRTRQVASNMAHLETKTPPRVSRKPASLQSGEILSPAVPGRHGVSSVSDTTPESSSRFSPLWRAASTPLNSEQPPRHLTLCPFILHRACLHSSPETSRNHL